MVGDGKETMKPNKLKAIITLAIEVSAVLFWIGLAFAMGILLCFY